MIFNKRNLLVGSVLFLVLFYYSAWADNIISVKDTLIPRGEIYSIPVNVNIEAAQIDSIEFEFEFNPFVIDIKSAIINPDIVISVPEISYYSNLTSLIGKFTVKIKNISNTSFNDDLFYLNIEGLVSSDSISPLKINKFWINQIITDYTANNAIINVPGEAILQNYPEGLFMNYPNPFRGSTTFTFNIEKKTTAKFELYNSLGINVFDESDILSRLRIMRIITGGPIQEIEDLTQELEPGKYYLVFRADETILASSHLIMVMKTKNDSYSKSFLFLK